MPIRYSEERVDGSGKVYSGAGVPTDSVERSRSFYTDFSDGELFYGAKNWKKSAYSNRITITLSNTNIDEDLTDFPVLILLNSTGGTGNTDVTAVFTELGVNSRKLAITTSDGRTECPIEIDVWDNSNSKASLWVKVPLVSSTADTILYLYYDSTADDNTGFVGILPTDSASQAVWSNGYGGVFHMNGTYDGTTGECKNSVSDANHLTSSGATHTAEISGPIGKAQDWDANNTALLSAAATTELTTSGLDGFTLETYALNKTGGTQTIINKNSDYYIFSHTSMYHRIYYDQGYVDFDTGPYPSNQWNYAVMRTSLTDELFELDSNDASYNLVHNQKAITGKTNNNADVGIFTIGNTASTINMSIEEVRYSTVHRSDAWIKASDKCFQDGIVSYGFEDLWVKSGRFIELDDTAGDGDTDRTYSSNKVIEILDTKVNLTNFDDTATTGDTTKFWSIDKIKSFFRFVLKDSSYTAVHNDKLLCDTTNGAFTITLPASPTIGDAVYIYDAKNTFDSNSLTISGGAEKIESFNDTYVLDVGGAGVKAVYVSAAFGWKII